MNKKKLKLADLKVASFITSEESRNVKGMTVARTDCFDTVCLSQIDLNLCPATDPQTEGCTATCQSNCTCATCRTCAYSCDGTCNTPCTLIESEPHQFFCVAGNF